MPIIGVAIAGAVFTSVVTGTYLVTSLALAGMTPRITFDHTGSLS